MSRQLSVYDRIDNPGQMISALGKSITQSGMFGCKNQSQGQIMALECMARRLPPMQLAERYHLIFGRLSMKSEAMLADFRTRCGGSHRVIDRTADLAVIELTTERGKSKEVNTFSLSWKEAKSEPFVYEGKESEVIAKLNAGTTAGLHIKAKYATPRARMQMLWARVVSDAVRTVAPEIIVGAYSPEEIEDFDELQQGPACDAAVEEIEQAAEDKPTEPTKTVEPVLVEAVQDGRLVLSNSPAEDDATEVSLDSPCGEETAATIKAAAQVADASPKRIMAYVTDHGCEKLADLSIRDAEELLRKLEKATNASAAPF